MTCLSSWLYATGLLLIAPFLPLSSALSTPTTKSPLNQPLLKNDQDLTAFRPHLRAKIAHSVAKGERRARERAAQGRADCPQCSRPDTLCVCNVLPPKKLYTQTKMLILQHPNERRKKNVSTVPLLKLSLQNVQVVGGYTFEPESLPLVQEVLEQGRKPLLLYPCADAISLDTVDNNGLAKGNNEADASTKLSVPDNNNLLIIMDGTWTEAKRMVRDSPRLVECCQTVQFTSEASSIYDALRSEPEEHCLSTLEACARTLSLLEPRCDDNAIQDHLHRILQAHVDAHLANARILAPRHVGAAKHKLFDKNKRRREIELTLFAAPTKEEENTRQRQQEEKLDQQDPSDTTIQDFVWQRLADGAMFRSLEPSDAALVDSWWEHRSAKSLPLVLRRLKLDRGRGVCFGVQVQGQLVASIMRYEGGALGMLYVDENFRRKGNAQALLEQATRVLEQRGEERVAFIVDGNKASEALFSSVGWERADPHIKGKTGKRRAKRKWIHKDGAAIGTSL